VEYDREHADTHRYGDPVYCHGVSILLLRQMDVVEESAWAKSFVGRSEGDLHPHDGISG
jgi:uncharacterized protein YsxB (DUF464 family)